MLKERPYWLPLQIALVCLLMVAALWAALAFESNRWERTAIEQSRRDATNLATGFREHIRRMIGAIDQLMITIIEENKEANANRIPKWIDESPLLKGMSLQVSITGPDGIMQASSLGLSGRIDLSDRPHIRYHLEPNAPQPYISVPVLGRLSGKWSIQVTRRITRSDGGFGGVLVVSVDPHYFSKFFESIDLGHDGVIVLAGLDGIVRARRSAGNQTIGQDLSGTPLLKQAQSAESGSYIVTSKVDAIERLYAFSRVPDYPLVVSVGTSTADIYATARRDRLGGVIAGIIVTISVIGLGLLLIREVDRRRRQSDVSIREQKDHLDAAVNNIRVGMTLWDQGGRLIFCNARFVEMYGLPSDQIRPGVSFADILRLRHLTGCYDDALERAHEVHSAMLVGQQQSHVLETKDRRTIQITSNPISDRGWVTIHEDITERRKADAKIAHLALHDILTGLPNRAAFNDTLALTMAEAKASGKPFSLLCIDVDRFKEVNDLFGHAVGDELLRQAADRFKAAVAPNFVSRLGGDEFVVIATEATTPDAALCLAKKLTSAFAAEFEINGFRLSAHLSIGISMYSTDAEDPVVLLVNADTALYRAKADGRDTIRFFESEMDRQLRDRWELKRELANALGTNQLALHYQPIAMTGRDIVGFEALARWSHPTRGAVPPDTFIPIAEESGLILQFGEWALKTACREAASWRNGAYVSVNLSAPQLRHGDLSRLVHTTLLETGLQPGRLQLEITESIMVDDFAQTLSVLRRLKGLGVRIALDDFGSGYSSLSYLHAFPFDMVKIDKAFIAQLEQNQQSTVIVKAIIGLVHGLGLPAVAEGVETVTQFDWLKREGCDEVQGYLIGKPKPIVEYTHIVQHEVGRRSA